MNVLAVACVLLAAAVANQALAADPVVANVAVRQLPGSHQGSFVVREILQRVLVLQPPMVGRLVHHP